MKKTLTVELIKDNGNQRFYKLSEKITKGFKFGKVVDLLPLLAEAKVKDFKPKYAHLCPVDGVDIICVSDATTHSERLVFAGMQWGNEEIGRTRVQIDGALTMMIHGGSERAMKPDAVYLRRLASINGFTLQMAAHEKV